MSIVPYLPVPLDIISLIKLVNQVHFVFFGGNNTSTSLWSKAWTKIPVTKQSWFSQIILWNRFILYLIGLLTKVNESVTPKGMVGSVINECFSLFSVRINGTNSFLNLGFTPCFLPVLLFFLSLHDSFWSG